MFKDLQKLVQQSSKSNSEQKELFEKLKDKPFWIWNVEEHKQEDSYSQEPKEPDNNEDKDQLEEKQ